MTTFIIIVLLIGLIVSLVMLTKQRNKTSEVLDTINDNKIAYQNVISKKNSTIQDYENDLVSRNKIIEECNSSINTKDRLIKSKEATVKDLRLQIKNLKKASSVKPISTNLVEAENVGDLRLTYKDKEGRNKSLLNATMHVKVEKGLLKGAHIMRGGARVPVYIAVRK